MVTLGINAAYHDPSAALVRDGVVLAAAEEERFTHVKHGKRPVPFSAWELPFHAIDYCLREAGIALAQVDHVAYSYDPALYRPETPLDELFRSYVLQARGQLADGAPHHLKKRFSGARADGPYRWHNVEHHLAHEASCFLAAPFEECAVLALDGRGERATTSYGVFAGGGYRRIGQVDLPHSLGLLYEEVTDYLGFLHSSDEYKVMALASYGEPAYAAEFRDILRPARGGAYKLAPARLAERFGPPRPRGGPLEPRHFDLARSLQWALEEAVMEIVGWLHAETAMENLAMAGGVALNCVMNARIRREGPFRSVWVQPAAGDAGTALGAALWIDHGEREGGRRWHMEHAYLGPSFGDEEIERFLAWSKLPYRRLENVAEDTARMLAEGRIVGWFQGRMEFGPRALGARSILASPIDPSMQARLNEIKDREDFRPVAPVVMEEHAAEWFEDAHADPFMVFVCDVRRDKEALVPAVRHVDGTARVQTVNRAQHPLCYDLLEAFRRRTGVPVLVNTSFNTRGEPIVCTPRDAVECFWTSPLDALVIGPFALEKRGAP
ncbi:MAG TPA: carbamoyltransferase C-terminal domain-containing protein [Burkholderiales bacterium]|jgi:carbamoyltransferase|nr:carbamoyltransferase C-terminal domain-containing protein [Burkholderiales bacterium]HEX2650049.1 carbamoyltransferase C-terminal domain-containing protein [Burkholderiales bacterium]